MSEATNELRLSAEQLRTLAGVLDEIIPPSDDASFPGAGALGLAAYVEQTLARTADLRPVIAQGLATIDRLVRTRRAESFATLCREDRLEVLNELAATDAAFLPSLTFHTYVGYYQHGRVLEALRLEARPPYPKGHEMQPSDLATLLEPVRRRAKLYRDDTD